MTICVSKKSALCCGLGNPIWGGMCSNCADEAAKPERIQKIRERQRQLEADRLDQIERTKMMSKFDDDGHCVFRRIHEPD
jgi:hypothetical protein